MKKPQVPKGPGVEGVAVIWPDLQANETEASFKRSGGASRWQKQSAGVTHLRNDPVPTIGGHII